MAYVPRILAFAGSARVDSYNRKLAKLAADAARRAGADVTYLDFAELPLPLFDQDSEARDGLPENARKLKQIMEVHEGLLIASPEYNSSVTPLLKNAIDWASRQATPTEPGLASLSGKTAAIISASPGALGGLRGLVHLRSILGNINVLVLPDQIAIPKAPEAFDADGRLKTPQQQATIEAIANRLVHVTARLHG